MKQLTSQHGVPGKEYVLHLERKPRGDRRLAPEIQPDQATPQSEHADTRGVRFEATSAQTTKGGVGSYNSALTMVELFAVVELPELGQS